jgi:hypothetical protein
MLVAVVSVVVLSASVAAKTRPGSLEEVTAGAGAGTALAGTGFGVPAAEGLPLQTHHQVLSNRHTTAYHLPFSADYY